MTMQDFKAMADRIRNWARWGQEDELGTLNLITAEKVKQSAALVTQGQVFPLGMSFNDGGPQELKFRRNPLHFMTVDGGDARSLLEAGPGWSEQAQGVEIGEGDIVLVRTGGMTKFLARHDTTPSAGLNWRCAEWLHERNVAAVAADNSQVEDPLSDLENNMLPMHLLCLRDMGLPFGEYWQLDAPADACAQDNRWDFQLVAPPLRITGAVGSPLNPIALR